MTAPTPRRTVLAAALAVAAASTTIAGPASASQGPARAARRPGRRPVEHRLWTSREHWRTGTHRGTETPISARPAVRISRPLGRTHYTDPRTGRTTTWEYATWTSPEHRPAVPATEAIVSWNARTPTGSWIQVELRATYSDGTRSPWYVMGRWASGDTDIRRTSVDGQRDGKTSVWTDTLAIDEATTGLRLVSYRLRLTLYRTPGSSRTPTVWLVGAVTSDLPDRFEVPASPIGPTRELHVPRYSQHTHIGQYPEYDNGGEAWCSPTSSQMVVEYWGRRPKAADLAWVDPAFEDPQVCHAARHTYDYQYEGCGNWPFNTAYAATYRGLAAVVTRLVSLTELERLVHAGIPAITSQSFMAEELTGAGYGTAGHLMTVVGFTPSGDVIANDPAAHTNSDVRRVYRRREWENIWLRTKRYDANGKVRGGTGGVCYIFWPARPTPLQRRVLAGVGITGR
ncbi:peptidase C39 family protein [Streptomyces sp. NPDC006879]|uniref:peptidase C39 family protein n=1 Tax=Streptomyces sp. NPDC006879 TaxID=3364767 RepID=UPI0036C64D54